MSVFANSIAMSERTRYRLKVVLLCIFSVFQQLRKSRRKPYFLEVKNILIPTQARFGDTILLVPLLERLSKRFPSASITLALPRLTADLFKTSPFKLHVLEWSEKEYGSVKSLLNQGPFDLAFVPWDNRMSWVARAVGARWIIGLAETRSTWKSLFLDEVVQWEEGVVSDSLAALVADSERNYAYSWTLTLETVATTQQPLPYAVLHLGASSPMRRWPAVKWQSLAGLLRGGGFSIVWSVGPGEENLIDECEPQACDTNSIGPKIVDLYATLCQASLIVSPDTGVAHLAKLTQTPTICIFGPGSPTLHGSGMRWRDLAWEPVWNESIACRDQNDLYGRKFDWVKRCTRNLSQCADARCIREIGVEEVYAKAQALLQIHSERALTK